ncbi:MAG: LamG domain-containing protein [Phycisphaeraceae bacterium]|nr:MAG: LamG domain-containing protein [Phycisphaeraceae bacterium]
MTRLIVFSAALICAGAAYGQVLSHIDFEGQTVGSAITSVSENGNTWTGFAATTGEMPIGSADVPGPGIRTGSAPATLLSGDFSPGFGYLETAAGAFDLSTSDWTIECFVKFNDVGGFQTMLGRDKDPLQTGTAFADMYFEKHNDGYFMCQLTTAVIDNGDGTFTYVDATARSALLPQAGQWYHVAAVYDGTARTLTLYVNGQQEAQVTDADNIVPVTDPVGQLYSVGRGQYNSNPVDSLNGQIDDLRITAAALTPAQMLVASPCTVDLNGDGSADMFDMLDFLAGYDAGGCN